jgi:Fe-S cluster assembly scaffold protein SufB
MSNYKFQVKKDEKRVIRVDKPGKYVVELVGEGAEAEIVGAFRGRNKDQIEIEIEVVHKAKNTSANTHIRGVVGDQARAMVVGTIRVLSGAQQTNSFLAEKLLILSERARAEAVPNLEIEANDVKCSHAATVGKIDEEQLFYLMSRGLRQADARDIIVEGFLAPVL